MILFTGTPCQIAGIKSYLKSYEKLYLVDIICHGVPPQQILKDHIKWKVQSEVSYFTTRNNEEYCLTLYDANQQIYIRRIFLMMNMNMVLCMLCSFVQIVIPANMLV